MTEALLATTSTEGLQPLGTAAQRSFELVTGTLRTRLGPEHAALFAEPVAGEHGDRIDWYAQSGRGAVRLADLPPADREAVRARLGQLVADIRTESAALAETGRSEDLRLSEALANALEVPGEDMIWTVRGGAGPAPVLVHWAWVKNERKPVRGVLTGMIPRPAPVAGVEPARRRFPWVWLLGLGWGLLAVLIAAILHVLVAPCGLNPAGPDFCPRADAPLAVAFAEEQVIADQIAALERAVALARRTCQPTVPLTPAEPAPQDRGDLGDTGNRHAALDLAAPAMRDLIRGEPARAGMKTEIGTADRDPARPPR